MVSFAPPEDVPVHELGVSSSEAVWLGDRAIDRLRAEARAAGLTGDDPNDAITLTPGAVATADALRRFRIQSEPVPGDVVGRLAGAMGSWADEPAFGRPARLVRLRGGGSCSSERLAAAARIEVEVEQQEVPIALADAPGGRTTSLTVSDALLCSTEHWSGLLWANLLSMPRELRIRLLGTSRAIGALRGLWAFLRTWSTDPFLLGGALSVIERGARVHPSAVVEGCWVRADARIGPGAVVRASIVGEGASIEPHALVAFAVLGPRSHVQRRGWIQFGVLHPGAALGGSMQLGVLGPDASVKHGALLMDQALEGEATALVDGRKVASPLGLLGVGVGARTVIGAGVHVAPGRSVPPDLTIAASPRETVRRIPSGLSGPVEVRDGELVPR